MYNMYKRTEQGRRVLTPTLTLEFDTQPPKRHVYERKRFFPINKSGPHSAAVKACDRLREVVQSPGLELLGLKVSSGVPLIKMVKRLKFAQFSGVWESSN